MLFANLHLGYPSPSKKQKVHVVSIASRERPTRFRKRAKIRSEGGKNVGTDERFARW